MIKTTRIKYSQAPRIIVDDLSPQCDGVKQTFTLSRPVPEWAPYCLVFNGQLYTNTSYKQWFVLDADRKTIHTSFITPPTQGPNKSLILIVGVAGMEDLGVTWDDIVNKPEIPTEAEVDAKDAAVLSEAKAYTDEHGGTGDVTKAYVDTQDAATLQAAKDYTDGHSGSAITFIDLTVQSISPIQDGVEFTVTSSKTLAEATPIWEAGGDVRYRLVLAVSPDPTTIATGTYEISPLYIGPNFAIGSFMDAYNGLNMSLWHEAGTPEIVRVAVYQSQPTITVDSSLSSSSTNPVQNMVITSALGDKVDSADLATVATTGSYSDLSGKPTVPSFTLQSSDPGEGGALAANNFIAVYMENS